MSTYPIENLIDIDRLKQFLEHHHLMSGMGCALLDNNKNAIVSVGRKDICARFQRLHPVFSQHCCGSDKHITENLNKHNYHEYRYGNGMVDVALPIIIQENHIATFFTGPFFYDDDPPDRNFIYGQALGFGFDPVEYLTILAHVPVFSREHVRSNLLYLRSLSDLVIESSLKSAGLSETTCNSDLSFFANLDAVNRAIQGTNDPRQMMNDVLNVVRSALFCDRAFLMYPRDPEAEILEVQIECTAPEYPGVKALGVSILQDKNISEDARFLLSTDEPVSFGFGSPHEIRGEIAERFTIRSILGMAVYPKVGNPWLFGIHQCSFNRVWSPDEKKYFEEVGRRLEDALTLLLTYRALRASEDTYRRIVYTAAEGIWLIQPDLITRFVNRHMAEMLGFPEEEIIGRSITDFMFEDDLIDYNSRLESYRQGQGAPYDFRFRHSNGQAIWAHVSATSSVDAYDCFNGIIVLCTDITERRKIEEQLMERERLLRTLFDNLPDFIARFDTEGHVFFLNQTATEFFEKPLDELAGNTSLSLKPLSDDGNRQLHEAVLNAVSQGEANSLETSCHVPGKCRHFEIRHIPEKDAHGSVVSVLGIARDITDKKLMENRLKESEVRYRNSSNLLSSILESATSVCVYALDCQYRYLAFNRRHSEEIKYLWEKDIAIGMNMLDAVADKYRDKIRQIFDQVLAGKSLSAEAQFKIVKNGKDRSEYYENHGSPIVNDNGEVVGLTFFAINITERKQMETTLFQREQEFRTLAENSPGMIVRYDLDCKRVYVNPAFTQKTRIQTAEALRTSPADSWLKPANVTAEKYISVLKEVMKTGVPSEILIEYPYPATGQLSYHHFHIVAEKNDHGDILGCLAIDHDITSLKEAQLKLDRLVGIFPGVLYTFCMKPDGTYSMPYASHRIKELMDFPLDELQSDTNKLFRWVHPDDYERLMSSIPASGQSLSPWQLEFRILHPDKGEVWVEGHSIPERQPDGSTLWHGCLHDITDRKQSEEKLSKKRRQLEELSSELSLAEERERKNIAATLHDHIGQTLLLGRIKLGTLAEMKLPTNQQKTVVEIRELLDQVTQDIHKLTVQLSPPILATAGLESALEWLGRRMGEDYGLFVEFTDDLKMKPLMDEVRSVVYQCARELLINVAKHAETDHARIVVARDDSRYRLTVEDDGVGFDTSILEHESSKDLRFGLLSIKIRMERLGGSVVYKSSPGQGSRMTLLSPLSKTDFSI